MSIYEMATEPGLAVDADAAQQETNIEHRITDGLPTTTVDGVVDPRKSALDAITAYLSG